MIAQTLAEALTEAQANRWYWRAFKRDNKNLAPLVEAYIQGTGDRPTDDQIGSNHYARSLVLVEDARRALTADVPALHEELASYDLVVSVPGEIEPGGRIPTAVIQ